MERRNGSINHRVVETSRVSGTGENVVSPTHAFVRLGPAQRVRVSLPMNQETLRVLAAVSKPRKG